MFGFDKNLALYDLCSSNSSLYYFIILKFTNDSR